jgi:hypothetical protein
MSNVSDIYEVLDLPHKSLQDKLSKRTPGSTKPFSDFSSGN